MVRYHSKKIVIRTINVQLKIRLFSEMFCFSQISQDLRNKVVIFVIDYRTREPIKLYTMVIKNTKGAFYKDYTSSQKCICNSRFSTCVPRGQQMVEDTFLLVQRLGYDGMWRTVADDADLETK